LKIQFFNLDKIKIHITTNIKAIITLIPDEIIQMKNHQISWIENGPNKTTIIPPPI